MRLTVGPLPPAVYWRRRAMVLGAALLVVFLIAQACMAAAPADDRSGGGADPTTAPPGTEPAPAPAPPALPPDQDDPAGTAASEQTADEEPADPAACANDEISVTAAAARTEFPVGEQVQFTIRIGHAGERSCTRDVGGDMRELYLVRDAGAGAVWSSQDCANPTGNEVVELSESSVDREHNIAFTGRSTSRCSGPEADGPELSPGEYQLFARLGTARSDPVTITLT